MPIEKTVRCTDYTSAPEAAKSDAKKPVDGRRKDNGGDLK
jgi:hypothetical protein